MGAHDQRHLESWPQSGRWFQPFHFCVHETKMMTAFAYQRRSIDTQINQPLCRRPRRRSPPFYETRRGSFASGAEIASKLQNSLSFLCLQGIFGSTPDSARPAEPPLIPHFRRQHTEGSIFNHYQRLAARSRITRSQTLHSGHALSQSALHGGLRVPISRSGPCGTVEASVPCNTIHNHGPERPEPKTLHECFVKRLDLVEFPVATGCGCSGLLGQRHATGFIASAGRTSEHA